MARKCKTGMEILGARPQIWFALILAALATLFFYRVRYAEPRRHPRNVPEINAGKMSAQVERNQSTSSPAPSGVRGAAHHASLPHLAVEAGLVGTDLREHEPVPVLINELFSPDPQVRMTAAMRLSRKSVYASEALPILKKLTPEESDPRVREAMKEAILNIRGFVPALF